jgi:hypothetical protein
MDILKQSFTGVPDTSYTRPSLFEIADLGRQLSMQSWVDLNKSTENIHGVNYLAKRILAILLIRILGILSVRGLTPKLPSFPDLSTNSICHAILEEFNCHHLHEKKEDLNVNDSQHEDGEAAEIEHECELDWPDAMTDEVVFQLHEYICKILEGYHSVSYHNRGHAYHVFTSASKLLDMVLCEYDYTYTISTTPIRRPARVTFGLKSDPLTQLAFLFSALVHDVEHTGVSNRQLVLECDELALMYNDQSVAEQRSLAIAFSMLMKKGFETLRDVLFQDRKEYMRFRKIVIDLVLCTDIASPERVQIVKSKWKEAFGDKRPAPTNNNLSSNIERQESSMSGDTHSVYKRNGHAPRHVAVLRCTDENSDDVGDKIGNSEMRGAVTFGEDMVSPNSSTTTKVRPNLAATKNSLTFSQRKKRNAWKSEPVDSSYYESGKSRLVRDFFSRRGSLTFRMKSFNKKKSSTGIDVGCSAGTTESTATKKKNLKIFRKGLQKLALKQMRMRNMDRCEEPGVEDVDENTNVETNSVARGRDSKHPITPPSPAPVADDRVRVGLGEKSVLKKQVVSSNKNNAEKMENIKGILSEYEDDLSVASDLSDATSVYVPTTNDKQKKFKSYSRKSQSFSHRKMSNDSVESEPRTTDNSISGMDPIHDLKPSRNASLSASLDSSATSTAHSPKLSRFKAYRRFTEPANALMDRKKFHFRLGIRRALDLTGNQIDAYTVNNEKKLENDPDDPDEFKVIVILEQLMKAADVAANMQGWETMVSWCKRLFEEQKKCHDDGRGEDPITEWHENQLGFFESYTMPLACRLAETGVFGFEEVQMLVNGVRQNNTRWIIEGRSVLNKMVKEWSNKQGKLC